MADFRIIAIKTGKRVTQKDKQGVLLDPLKVLQENTIYPFYSHYSFPNNNFSVVEYDSSIDVDLYGFEVTTKNREQVKQIGVNINAIVGANGSGKSTLLELLCWANYNIGAKLGLMYKDYKRGTKRKPHDFLDFEILYCSSREQYIQLIFKNGSIRKRYANGSGSSTIRDAQSQNKVRIQFSEEAGSEIKELEDLEDYFYSVFINYSHYAFNDSEVGSWVSHLFHKNDGYQTPIVLNPYREENGIIDINHEKKLLSRRLLANLLQPVTGKPEESLRNVVNGKIAENLHLTYSSTKYPHLLGYENRHEIPKYFIPVVNKFFGIKKTSHNEFSRLTYNYLHDKLWKIRHLYEPFKIYDPDNSKAEFENLLKAVVESESHISFKVKGAALYLKYFGKIFGSISIAPQEHIEISIQKLSDTIIEIKNLEKERDLVVTTFMMAPTSLFDVDITFTVGGPFSTLSSGEKQKIHSISSIVYHIINLNSVEQFKNNEKIVYNHYRYLNVVLDEIELYYHPEWQRRYIHDLLEMIQRIEYVNLSKIDAINFMISTHSPFILSDIPHTNILFLKKDAEQVKDTSITKSFGGNIHDLLRHSFFLNEGSMGELARKRINSIIKYLNYRIEENLHLQSSQPHVQKNSAQVAAKRETELPHLNDNEVSKTIKIIDDPIISRKLMEMFDSYATYSLEDDFLAKQIQRLEEQRRKLKKNL